MCNRTYCYGSAFGPMACAVCGERDMSEMKLTDAELARLEELAELYLSGKALPFAESDYRESSCNAVPSLVAEVRRLRDAIGANATLYMDVTTVCPDCIMQGKPSDGCQLCDGRGRAFLHDVLRRGNAELETLRDAGEGLENDGYMANAFGKKGQDFPFPPYSQKWWEAVALNAARLAQENAALRERVEALEWLVECFDNCKRRGALPLEIHKTPAAYGESWDTLWAAREAIK